MTKMNARWEGPINGELQHTAIVREGGPTPSIIETNLEGLAAIASGLFAVEAMLERIADSMDVLNTTLMNR